MEDIAVVIIFAACVGLLLFAYLATTIRCSLWCRKGMKTDFSEPNKDEVTTISAVTILSASQLSTDDVKPVNLIVPAAEPTKPEVIVVEPRNGIADGHLYVVSIDVCSEPMDFPS